MPTPPADIQVWADEECTVRPEPNAAYSTLYLLVNGLPETNKEWNSGVQFSNLLFTITDDPEEYNFELYWEFHSIALADPPAAGSVIPVTADGDEPVTLGSSLTVDFYIDEE